MVEADNYLVQLVAYLHLNPVRARLVENPVDYPWSSHRAYLGLEQSPCLTREIVLSQFTNSEKKAQQLFGDFVEAFSDEGHRPEFHGMNIPDGRVFGDDTFIEMVLRDEQPMHPISVDDVLAAVREICGLTSEEMCAPTQGALIAEGRALAAWGVLYLSNGTLTDLGKILGRDVTSLSSAAKRLLGRKKNYDDVAKRMDSVRNLATKFATLQS